MVLAPRTRLRRCTTCRRHGRPPSPQLPLRGSSLPTSLSQRLSLATPRASVPPSGAASDTHPATSSFQVVDSPPPHPLPPPAASPRSSSRPSRRLGVVFRHHQSSRFLGALLKKWSRRFEGWQWHAFSNILEVPWPSLGPQRPSPSPGIVDATSRPERQSAAAFIQRCAPATEFLSKTRGDELAIGSPDLP